MRFIGLGRLLAKGKTTMTGEKEHSNRPGPIQGVIAVDPEGYRRGLGFRQLLDGLLTDAVWVAKFAKDHFYDLFNAVADRPQMIRHRDGRNLVVMSEETYEEMLAGWKEANEPHSLADQFRAARITHAIARPEKFKQHRPRALDLVEDIEASNNIKPTGKGPAPRETMRG